MPRFQDPDLSIDAVDEGRAVRLVLAGELDLAVADRLRVAIETHATRGAAVVLDLRRLEFMDSTGLSTLLSAHSSAERQGWDFAVIAGDGAVNRLFELTDARSILRFVETTADLDD
jgi:anti-sigma B factor antagonist